jgi:hypothetical protein
MEPRFGYDFSEVRVHSDAQAAESARAIDALAYTVGRHVVLAQNENPSMTSKGQLTLAHELAHVVQQAHGQMTPRLAIGDANTGAEEEAERLAHAIVRGSITGGRSRLLAAREGVHVQRQPDTLGQHFQSEGDITPTNQTPHDKLVVERAKKRLELLKKYVDEYAVREARRLRSAEERDKMLKKREKMDTEGDDPFVEIAPRGKIEEQRVAALNALPLDIDVTPHQITFRVKFHVRFEDSKQESKFDTLKVTPAFTGQAEAGYSLTAEKVEDTRRLS